MEFKVISPCGCSALIPPPFIKPISEPVTKRKASAQKSPILVSVFLIKRFPFSSCVISLTSEVPIQVCPKISLSCRILEMYYKIFSSIKVISFVGISSVLILPSELKVNFSIFSNFVPVDDKTTSLPSLSFTISFSITL